MKIERRAESRRRRCGVGAVDLRERGEERARAGENKVCSDWRASGEREMRVPLVEMKKGEKTRRSDGFVVLHDVQRLARERRARIGLARTERSVDAPRRSERWFRSAEEQEASAAKKIEMHKNIYREREIWLILPVVIRSS